MAHTFNKFFVGRFKAPFKNPNLPEYIPFCKNNAIPFVTDLLAGRAYVKKAFEIFEEKRRALATFVPPKETYIRLFAFTTLKIRIL